MVHFIFLDNVKKKIRQNYYQEIHNFGYCKVKNFLKPKYDSIEFENADKM